MIKYFLQKSKNRIFLWLGYGTFEYVKLISFLCFLEKYAIPMPKIISDQNIRFRNIDIIAPSAAESDCLLLTMDSFCKKQAEDAACEYGKSVIIISLDEVLMKRQDEIDYFLNQL